jgi:hypothetical protein
MFFHGFFHVFQRADRPYPSFPTCNGSRSVSAPSGASKARGAGAERSPATKRAWRNTWARWGQRSVWILPRCPSEL